MSQNNTSQLNKTILIFGLLFLFILGLFFIQCVIFNKSDLQIMYPFDGALFPPEIVTPRFWWHDENPGVEKWRISFEFKDKEGSLVEYADTSQWTPDRDSWESIKHRSLGEKTKITIDGLKTIFGFKRVVSRNEIWISISQDSVSAPLFYREVPLPFRFARQSLTSIQWRLGDISSYEPPQVVLENLPTCANCHSFSADGKTLGMDVDFRLDKGGYVVTAFEEETVWTPDKIISWTDYDRSLRIPTFGLLSSLSPDGRYVLSSVRDRAVFLDQDDLYFSQLFFPVIGILAYYDTKTEEFHDLPGADDPEYVQSNGVWSPDGQTIVFARNEAAKLTVKFQYKGPTLIRPEAAEVLGGDKYVYAGVEGRKKFLFNLYKMPFNSGKGGEPIPIPGASHNGKSNFFAKYSPDGKWIVFTQAPSFMLNQQGSELYIVPVEGGSPRRMDCNLSRMNSWHSWSPNSRWLVFSSKVFRPYTQLFLTHIDEYGNDAPPVLLRDFTAPDRAANIPEFVNIKPGSKRKINPVSIK